MDLAPFSAKPARWSRLRLLMRLLLREAPASISGFGILIACIAIGVASIVAVASLSRALNEGIGREGRVILGGDAAFSLVQRAATAQERAVLARQGAISETMAARAMARIASGDSALVEVKAVDAAYPSVGKLELEGKNGPMKRPSHGFWRLFPRPTVICAPALWRIPFYPDASTSRLGIRWRLAWSPSGWPG